MASVSDDERKLEALGEPITPAEEGFAALHEWYTGLVGAGFTMTEAATIIGAVLVQSGQSGQQS
jgi:hypothetical protein